MSKTPGTSEPELPEDIECWFCHWDQREPGWFSFHERRSYGRGPDRDRSGWLCGFCANSYTVSAWLAGADIEHSSQVIDLFQVANRLRRIVMDPAGPLALHYRLPEASG